MRALPVIIAAVFVAGFVSTPSIDTTKAVDYKYNTIRYAPKPQHSEFVGTSANASGSTKWQPSWYKYGHP
jgi:hypothetical protein